ncbi:insulinase family protein [Pseudomonas capeferrum]|uniref:M16 family metallopeptidase n=1 Tax=Pseudomonas capeferrum TaxID=1495066 RepID=UPI0015E3BBA8|nr:pitrilysin family protein [Pseudomonas capeferrum]MBA1202324.1 insulinase family protein [Pseudomonas capeferrum]
MNEARTGLLAMLFLLACASPPAMATQEGTGGLTSLTDSALPPIKQVSPDIQAWTTEAGSSVMFVQAPELPMIDLRLRFTVGSASDGETSGLAALTLGMLEKGTQGASAEQIAEQLDDMGAQLSTTTRLVHSTLAVRSLSRPRERDTVVNLISAMLGRPAMVESELETLKTHWQDILQGRATHPVFQLRKLLFDQIFVGHPYATHYFSGTPEGIAALTTAQLAAFHRQAFTARNLTLSIVGDLSRQEAEALAQQISQTLPEGAPLPPLPAVAVSEPEIIHLERPGAGNWVGLAVPLAINARDPDYLALTVVEQMLGSSQPSRFHQALREQRGLSYRPSAGLIMLEDNGLWLMEWDIDARFADASQDLVQQLLADFVAQGPTQAELDLAVEQVANQYLQAVSSNRAMADTLMRMGQDKLPSNYLATYLDRMRALTPEGVRDALQRHFDLDRTVLASVGPTVEQQPLPGPDGSGADLQFR